MRQLWKISVIITIWAGAVFAQCGAGIVIPNPFGPVPRFLCTAPTGAGSGTVTSVGLVGTSRQMTITGASPITTNGSFSLSFPTNLLLVKGTGLTASDTGGPSLNMPSGVAPTTPTSGDIWNLSGVFQYYNGSVTQSLAATGVANAWTAAQSFANATSLTTKVGAGYAPTANGSIGYDSTANLYKFGVNGASKIVGLLSGSFTDNDCLKFQTSSGLIISNGTACASAVFQANGVNLTTQSTVNFLNSAATTGLTLAFSNPAAGSVQLGLSGALTVPGGGTGLTSFTSGGIPCLTGATTMASSAALGLNAPLLGGGAGGCVAAGTRAGTTTSFATTTGSLTNTAIPTFDSNANLAATGVTIDASNNISTPGGITSGSTSNKTGYDEWFGVTSGGQGFTVNDIAGTATLYVIPSAPSTGNFLKDNGSTTCPTLPAGAPAACEALVWASPTGSGTVNSGTGGQLAYYAGTGTAVSGNTNLTITAGALTLGVAGVTQGSFALAGSGSGSTLITAPSSGGGTMAFQAGSDTVVGRATTDTLTNKTLDCASNTCTIPANDRIHGISFTMGDVTNSSALTTSNTTYLTVPFACTIAAWNLAVDAGTITVDVWKIASGTAIPTVTNTITASALPAIASGTALHSTTLTGWTTSVAANDILAAHVNTVATAKFVNLVLQCNTAN